MQFVAAIPKFSLSEPPFKSSFIALLYKNASNQINRKEAPNFCRTHSQNSKKAFPKTFRKFLFR